MTRKVKEIRNVSVSVFILLHGEETNPGPLNRGRIADLTCLKHSDLLLKLCYKNVCSWGCVNRMLKTSKFFKFKNPLKTITSPPGRIPYIQLPILFCLGKKVVSMRHGGNTDNSKLQRLIRQKKLKDKKLILLEHRIEGVSQKQETKRNK